MSTTTKINYAKETKALIKDGINRLGGELTNLSTFRSYASVLNAIYNALPKVSGTGSNLSLSPTLKGGLDITPKGACEQDTIAYIDVGTWKQGGIYGDTGQEYSDTTIIRTDNYIEVKPNVLYNISRTISISFMAFRFYDNNKTILGTQATSGMVTTNQSDNRMNDGVSTMTMTINNTNVAYMRMVDSSNDLSTVYTISTQAPNPSYPQDVRVVTGDNEVVVSNKNLFSVAFQRGFWNPNGTYNTQTTTTSTMSTPKFKLKAGSYVISNSKITRWQWWVVIWNNGYNAISKATTRTFTLTEDSLISYQFNSPLGEGVAVSEHLEELSEYMMLEKGNTTTEYVPHAEQKVTLHLGSNYMAGIDTYDDEIVGKTDDWKIVRNIKKLVLNGTQTFTKATTRENIFYSNLVYDGTTSGLNILCSCFVGSEPASSVANMYGHDNNTIAISTTTDGRLYIKTNKFANVNELSTYLTNNNADVYYQLAESTETPITDTTLISDLNNMYNAMGYDGQTNITITSNSANAQMTAQVKALKGE